MDNDQLRKAMEDIRAVREMEASDAPVWYGVDEASAWANGFNDAAKKVIEYITTIAAQPPVEPYAWVVPGDDQSRPSGSIDAMAWREGEFTKPLYAQPQAAPAWEDLTAIIRPMIESVCSDGNSDAARLAKDIADRIIASCSLTRSKEK